MPLVKGGQNLPPMVRIGLNDLPNIGGPDSGITVALVAAKSILSMR